MRVDVLLHLKRFRYRYLVSAAVLLLGAALLCFLSFNDPESFHWYPPCLFHEATGLYCFGCGNTRALYLLTHGDVVGSLRKNVLLLPGCIFLLVSIWKPRWVNSPAVMWSAAVVIIGFTVLRNLPWMPFSLLAPH